MNRFSDTITGGSRKLARVGVGGYPSHPTGVWGGECFKLSAAGSGAEPQKLAHFAYITCRNYTKHTHKPQVLFNDTKCMIQTFCDY